MGLLDLLRASRKKDSANTARERLQIVVTHERARRNSPDYLPQMQQELLAVIRKYVDIDQEQVTVNLERDGDYGVLELNVVLPDLPQRPRP